MDVKDILEVEKDTTTSPLSKEAIMGITKVIIIGNNVGISVCIYDG